MVKSKSYVQTKPYRGRRALFSPIHSERGLSYAGASRGPSVPGSPVSAGRTQREEGTFLDGIWPERAVHEYKCLRWRLGDRSFVGATGRS